MARKNDDTWDLASGVGATATAVAASRALANRAGLIDDTWAEPLVRAVGMEQFVTLLDRGTPAEGSDVQRMAHGMAIRTRYFDDFLHQTSELEGIRQTVILATGLDARAYRLPWPTNSVVFEIDQPGVVDFKASALAGLGAESAAEVRNVGVDLRENWPAALLAHGFDTDRPTAWIAEGLLIYLPPDAQDRLFDHITALSPAGSRLATEFMPEIAAFTDATGVPDEPGENRWRRLGFHDDLAGLVFPGERSHVIEYLAELGWRVDASALEDLFAANGFENHDDEMAQKFVGLKYLSATLG